MVSSLHKAPQQGKKNANVSETWKLQDRRKYQSICKEGEGENRLVGTKRKLQDFSSRKLFYSEKSTA